MEKPKKLSPSHHLAHPDFNGKTTSEIRELRQTNFWRYAPLTRKTLEIVEDSVPAMSARAVAERLDCSIVSAHCALRSLHNDGLIHISGYSRPSHGNPSALYRAGKGRDAKRPTPISQAERTRRSRSRQRDEIVL